jgi:hypothetical protein
MRARRRHADVISPIHSKCPLPDYTVSAPRSILDTSRNIAIRVESEAQARMRVQTLIDDGMSYIPSFLAGELASVDIYVLHIEETP